MASRLWSVYVVGSVQECYLFPEYFHENTCFTFLYSCLFFPSQVVLSVDFPTPYPAPPKGVRLTPPEKKEPHFNAARCFGARPGSPVFFPISVSGQRPVKFRAIGLPPGLTIDEQTGIISGCVAQPGEFAVTVEVSNARGKASQPISIRIGDEICLTPPMGWNSWYSFSEGVSQENILKVANQLVDSGLACYGYNYVNIDDCWQGKRGGEYNAIQPNDRFPDMKSLCDSSHKLGLRIGIYSTPWMGTYAGHIGGTMPNQQGDYSALSIPEDRRLTPYQIFGRYPGVIKQEANKIGSVWMIDDDIKQWAEWGFDYVKMDWCPNDVPTTKRIAEALRKSKRDIVLSLSNSAPFENRAELARLANLWRTTGDISDHWGSIRQIANAQEKWQALTSPGHWNDPDMLQVGRLGKPNRFNAAFQPSRLSADEQYYQMTLWSILSAPLLISCDLEELDDFTRGLLCNSEIISINQDFCGCAKKVKSEQRCEVWVKPLSNNKTAVGFFNAGERKKTVTIRIKELGYMTGVSARDAWRQETVGNIQDEMSVEINPHGTACFILSPLSAEVNIKK